MATGSALKAWQRATGDTGLNVEDGGVRRDEMWI